MVEGRIQPLTCTQCQSKLSYLLSKYVSWRHSETGHFPLLHRDHKTVTQFNRSGVSPCPTGGFLILNIPSLHHETP